MDTRRFTKYSTFLVLIQDVMHTVFSLSGSVRDVHSEMFEEAYERGLTSWNEAWIDYEARVEQGIQPSLPGVDTKTMVAGNLAYLMICALLYLVMSQRKEGFRLKSVIVVYNAICVLLAGYVVVGILLYKLETPGSFACNPLDTSKRGQQMAFIFWVFYAQKYWEFLDTWFYILRRSFRQVTFLHLFHHSSITLVVGAIVRFDFSGDMYLPVFLNAVVHVLMYSHYLLTACGIKSWWRPYLTSLQITQFIAISTQSYLAYQGGSSCGAPDFAKLILMSYMASMIILFLNFFVRRYVFRKPSASMSGVIKSYEQAVNEFQMGTVQLDVSGKAVVALPTSVDSISGTQIREFHYQLTPIGTAMPNLHVEKEILLDKVGKGVFIVAGGEPRGKVSWQIQIVTKCVKVPKKSKTC